MEIKTPNAFDPDGLAAIIAQTFHRMTLVDPKPLETLDEFPSPISETMIKVLIEQTARESGTSEAAIREMCHGREALAAYVGFDFALRCVAAVLVDPLADHRADFQEAARVTSSAFRDEERCDIRFINALGDVNERFRLRTSFASPHDHDGDGS